MDVVVRTNKQSVIYRNLEYVKQRENRCGTTSWRCQKFQSMQCKARLVTSGDRVVSNRQPEHSELCEHYVNSVKLCLCYVFQTMHCEHSLNSIH